MMEELLHVAFVVIKKSVNPTVLKTYYWALDSMPYRVILYSLAGEPVYVNRRTPYSGESSTHRRKGLGERYKLARKEKLHDERTVLEMLETGDTTVSFVKDGRNYKREVAYVLTPAGEQVGIIDFVRPVDKAAEKNIKMWKTMLKARYDMLTNLYNHDSFVEVTHKFLNKYPEGKYILVIWDVIHFKMINSTLGIETGDLVLQIMGDKIKTLVQARGIACRLIGDKFAACLPEEDITEEWLRNNAEIMLADGKNIYKFETQFGLCRIQDNAESVHVLLDNCMIALRSNLEARSKVFTWYAPDMADKLREEQELLREAEIAFEEGQFVPYLQPVYSVATGKVIAAEALARWQHPTKGLIPPAQFIPLFERYGMIFRLDLCIWDQVGAMLAKQREKGESWVPVSINASRVDFLNPYLVEELDNIVTRYNLSPSQLRIEVTESAYAEEPDKIIKLVDILRAKGFGILLDDFGSGYSSLNILKDISVDILKIDMKFMDKFEQVERAGNIVANVVRMAHELDLEVVAEGVETEEQARFLREIGCEYIQGYYYAKPQAMHDFKTLLHRGQRHHLSYDTNDKIGEEFKKSAFVKDTSKEDGMIFRHYIGASAFYKVVAGEFGLLRANEDYYRLAYVDDAVVEQGPTDILAHLPEQARLQVLAVCREGRAERRPLKCIIKQPLHDSQRDLLLEINYIVDIHGQAIYFIHFVDMGEIKGL